MSNLIKGKATICVVNYKTFEFIRLCLRSIRKFIKYLCEIIVVDNNSQDQSLEYLRSLKWIRLVERQGGNELLSSFAHGSALGLGLKNCNTEFFVSMHSDTFVKKDNWLTELIGYFNDDENVACVGFGKIELTPKWRNLLKKSTDLRTFKRKLLREPDPLGIYRYHNRAICCLYRTNILQSENLSFLMDKDKGLTSGQKLYFELVDRGYKTIELPPKVLGQFVCHFSHATQAFNPQEFTLRKKTVRKYKRLIKKVMASKVIKDILEDASLDR